MIVISSATRIKYTPPKLKNRIMCLDHRKWNTLAFRGRLMSLLELRSVGSHRGLWDCDYSPHRKHFLPLESRVFQLLGWVFLLNELLKLIHPIIIYMNLSFVNSKRYLVD